MLKVNQAKTAITVEQQKLENMILIIVIAFVSVLGFIQWQSSNKRREVNVTLAQQNEFIQNPAEVICIEVNFDIFDASDVKVNSLRVSSWLVRVYLSQ